jgi:hypothetical protein
MPKPIPIDDATIEGRYQKWCREAANHRAQQRREDRMISLLLGSVLIIGGGAILATGYWLGHLICSIGTVPR